LDNETARFFGMIIYYRGRHRKGMQISYTSFSKFYWTNTCNMSFIWILKCLCFLFKNVRQHYNLLPFFTFYELPSISSNYKCAKRAEPLESMESDKVSSETNDILGKSW